LSYSFLWKAFELEKKKKNKNEKEFLKLKGQDILKGGKRNLRKRPSERGKDPAFSPWNVAITFYSFLFTFNPLEV
jgi:hypothetical protein